MIWKVVELSKPFDISSINKALIGPAIISPVGRAFCSKRKYQSSIFSFGRRISLVSWRHRHACPHILQVQESERRMFFYLTISRTRVAERGHFEKRRQMSSQEQTRLARIHCNELLLEPLQKEQSQNLYKYLRV